MHTRYGFLQGLCLFQHVISSCLLVFSLSLSLSLSFSLSVCLSLLVILSASLSISHFTYSFLLSTLSLSEKESKRDTRSSLDRKMHIYKVWLKGGGPSPYLQNKRHKCARHYDKSSNPRGYDFIVGTHFDKPVTHVAAIFYRLGHDGRFKLRNRDKSLLGIEYAHRGQKPEACLACI